MQKLLIFLIPLIFLGYCSRYRPIENPKQLNTFSVSGKVEYTEPYCGGARPTQEMVAELQKPKPFANLELVIRAGDRHDPEAPGIKLLKTDAQGQFETELPNGTYCIVLKEKADKPDYSKLSSEMYQVAEPCNENWMKECEITFEVKDAPVSGLALTLHKRCFQVDFNPCVMYIGPMPP